MKISDFETSVRYKLRGWYGRQEYEDLAVQRIINLREEYHALLSTSKREGLASLLDYLDECGFYYRPSSADRHHNYPGGLAEHCLGVYRKMASENLSGLDEESILIVGLFHDLCKCDMFYFVGRSIHAHKRDGHGRRSVRILGVMVYLFPERNIGQSGIIWDALTIQSVLRTLTSLRLSRNL